MKLVDGWDRRGVGGKCILGDSLIRLRILDGENQKIYICRDNF